MSGGATPGDAPPPPMTTFLAPPSPLQRLWRRLATPVDAVAAADVLVGLPPPAARQLLGVALAVSPEAEELLDGIGSILRSLAVRTASIPVRCDGEIRGPVLWGETMAARAASPGAGGVYICASATKAYDTDENRVLVGALHRVLRAARVAEGPPIEGGFAPDPSDLRRAQHNGDRARRALEHRSLQSVARVPPGGRMLQKARTGSKAATLRPAVSLLARSWAEVGADDLAPFVDERAEADHRLAADAIDRLAAAGVYNGRLRIDDGYLVGGPFRFAHRGAEAVLAGRAIPGVTIGSKRVRSGADLDALDVTSLVPRTRPHANWV